MESETPVTVYLALGSNLGDRMGNLRQALRALRPTVMVTDISPVYESAAAYVLDQPHFLNLVCRAETALTPTGLLTWVKQIEHDMGRETTIRYGPRPIDIDILFYDDLTLNLPHLTLPHPRLQERAFVLVPLADLAPELVHPQFKQSVQDLLNAGPLQGPVLHRLVERIE